MSFEQWALALQTLAQLGTLAFLIWYTFETSWIRKTAAKQTEVVSAQLRVMQETLDRQVTSDQLADTPCIIWEKDTQLAGWMWRIRNTGGPATILETRCSAGTLHVRPFLDTGEACVVAQASANDPEQRKRDDAATEEYYGIKYRSNLGIVTQKVYRDNRQSSTPSEAPEVPFDSLGNSLQPT
jgi:hypothetical protein